MSKFQIIIPMSGFGNRFKKVGYSKPKPMLLANKIPIIAHIIDLFPGEKDFLFICNNDHLNNENFKIYEILKRFCPDGKVIGIESHKRGPINAILKAKKYIKQNKRIIINYCDFNCYWQWDDFKTILSNDEIDGAIPAYKGFHPHSFGQTNYAYVKESNLRAIDIKEKSPFTKNKINEYASSGTYYFKNASEMLLSFNYVLKKNLSIKGEFYVSLAYKHYFKHNKNVIVYPLQHFSQWGTPEDFETYNKWSQSFIKVYEKSNAGNFIKKKEVKNSVNIFLLAGEGMRFVKENYKMPKPLIKVSGKPMIVQAIDYLPKSNTNIFMLRKNIYKFNELKKLIEKKVDNPIIKSLNQITSGQASTAFEAIKRLKKSKKHNNNHILFAPCDAGVLYNHDSYLNLLEENDADIIVWTSKNYEEAKLKPEMYGWVKSKNNLISKVLVKKSPQKFEDFSIIIGIFTFKNMLIFEKCYNLLIRNKNKIKSEYYLDSMIDEAIKVDLKCVNFFVDEYFSWGTPYELKTFNYWQSYFHKWARHPYDINIDLHASDKKKLIKNAYKFEKNNIEKTIFKDN